MFIHDIICCSHLNLFLYTNLNVLSSFIDDFKYEYYENINNNLLLIDSLCLILKFYRV